MIKTLASVGLPVDETLKIKKNRLQPEEKIKGKKKRGKWPLCLGLTI